MPLTKTPENEKANYFFTNSNSSGYYAHAIPIEDKAHWQLLKDHLENTAILAEELGKDAGVSELAKIAALFHDIGKYSKEFQARLEGARQRVDHATAGAKEIKQIFNNSQNEKYITDILAYCIAGHHTGLPDYGSKIDVEGTGTLLARLNHSDLKDYSDFTKEIDISKVKLPSRLKIKLNRKYEGFSLAFFTRMVFSALVDADFLETEIFMNKGKKERGSYKSIEELCSTYNHALKKYDNPKNNINKKRTETLKACIEKAQEEQGFFTLTVPTGGGKTESSMAFALTHAVKYGLKRIIYVIPFTSIIEQNAEIFKNYLGEENVLEHHSNYDWKMDKRIDTETADDKTKTVTDKLKLASENWDIPIVVSTNVQFFESLFANKSSRCRKLHNIAKSVIIFDEAQMLPMEYLAPCMLAVKELVTNYGTSVVFCTATQPVLNKHFPNIKFRELAPDPQELYDFYKRIKIENIGKQTDSDLIEKIQKRPQALCIVNTRRHARGLFDQLSGEGNYHLSTLMCPAHRKEILTIVKNRLQAERTCRVISTQVMEAGIDLDFPVGFRALAGLDSIIQAAGRVNREMKREASEVFIFDPDTDYIKRNPTFIEQGARITENVLREFNSNADSIQAIEYYFNFLDSLQATNAFDVKKIISCFHKNTGELDFDFKQASENFRLIENRTVGLVIPYNKTACELIEMARERPNPYSLARQLQVFTVNIYENEFINLQNKAVIETINDVYDVLAMDRFNEFYSKETGLLLQDDSKGEAIFFD